MAVARHNGVDLQPGDYRATVKEDVPSPASLVTWAREQGLSARAERVRWKQLFKLQGAENPAPPIVLLLKDGGAALMVGSDAARNIVWLRDPTAARGDDPVAVDELRLSQAWTGEVLLIRRLRGEAEENKPFSLGWLMGLVAKEKRVLRDISIGSITLSALTIIPPLLVMTVVDRVVVHNSMSTLVLLSVILVVTTFYEMLLGYARRELVQVVSTRVDARLHLHVFNRLLGLPLDYFEKNPAGQINYNLSQVWKVREFLTGKLMGTFLDMFTLVFLLPLLFWMEPTLAWIVLVCAAIIALVILAFLPSLRSVIGRLTVAESNKASTMVETVHGIRTVKSLALEPQRRAEWDERTAHAGQLKLQAGRLANWPQTIINPIEGFIQRGVIMIGAYIAMQDSTGIAIGGLVAFMMLGSRVTQPLVGLARLIEDFEDVRASIGQVAAVLNNPSETAAMQGGMRPRFVGAVTFEGLTFAYPGSKLPALDKVSFEVPAGTMLGVVGRSGSGKSTITRLLQGINREYSGFLKIDGVELKEINLTHLRRSFGVVLQDNFLFRGTVRDNITAGRPGLTLEDVVKASRLAGAEEFIERLPQGYDTWIEEGSANLSGGQRQRLAIARAVIADPRLMILDEATSALDPESEALVNANLTRLGKGRTMVIVSHRLSSLIDCDLILVMDKGTVVDIAPHRVLLERCAIYKMLWSQQNRHLDGAMGRQTPAPVLAQGD
ncbi:MAG: peptidase domain-containing ABC transporter [Gemmatimonadaceae bacterium]|nr:peptidase domain-containing ABC transporter [Acetobacteraceae bacterium]